MATKLTPALKALVNAPHARGAAIPAPPHAVLSTLFNGIRSAAESNGVDRSAWLTLSSAALVTLNSPETLCRLYSYAKADDPVQTAFIMREAGLKTISFSGIPRAINSLNALRDSLDPATASALPTTPTRALTSSNVSTVTQDRALSLWSSIYSSVSSRLLEKLSSSHPDLPVHILSSHYGALLADPPAVGAPVGRVLTSVVAVACLRAQSGVSPQVLSHVFGLRRALDGRKEGETDQELKGERWLVSDEGCAWVLESVDSIVAALGQQPSFAPVKAKL